MLTCEFYLTLSRQSFRTSIRNSDTLYFEKGGQNKNITDYSTFWEGVIFMWGEKASDISNTR